VWVSGAAAVAAVLLVAGCTSGAAAPSGSTAPSGSAAPPGSAAPSGAGSTVPSTAATSSHGPATATASSALPGPEALVPAAPDPAAATHLGVLAGLTGTSLRGHLHLTVSGLVGFDEDVTGTCTTSPARSTFLVRLADGSTDTTAFDATGGSTLLRAPDGTTSTNTLQEVRMTVQHGVLTLAAGMVTTGTTEASGRIALTATCS
jgi:hypothetical protein